MNASNRTNIHMPYWGLGLGVQVHDYYLLHIVHCAINHVWIRPKFSHVSYLIDKVEQTLKEKH